MTYLWFVTKKGIINFHNCPRTPKNDLILEELCCAYLSEPLEYISCRCFSDLYLLNSISYWVFSCPKVDDQQPLLKGHPRLGKKTSFPNTVSSFTLRTFPALAITSFLGLSTISIPHLVSYIYIISIHVPLLFFFFFDLLTIHRFYFGQAIHGFS